MDEAEFSICESKRKVVLTFLICAAVFAVFLAILLNGGSSLGSTQIKLCLCVAGFGIATVIFLVKSCLPARKILTLRPDGVAVSLLFDKRVIPWTDVEGFRIDKAGNSERGLIILCRNGSNVEIEPGLLPGTVIELRTILSEYKRGCAGVSD